MVADLTRDGKVVSARIDSLTELGAKQSRPMKRGDVVIAVSGAPGLPAILAHDACIHDGFVGLRELNNTRLDAEFLYAYLTFIRATSNSKAVGAIFKNLTTDQIKSIEIPDLPLAEQRRIAEVLDKAEALRAKRRAALTQLDSLTQSLFLDLFGDAEGKLKRFPCGALDDFCSFLSGFAWKADRFSKDPVGLPIIRIQNVDAVRDSDFIYWPDEYQERFVIHKGDLLLTLSGSFRIAEWSGPHALLNQRIVRIESKPGVERLWLLHAVRLLVAKIESLGRHALVNNVALSDLKHLPLVHPPIDLQREFARRVAAVEKLKAAQRAALAELDALFASLQHRAFRGEI
jgi:type I restriction enzyme S subunit